MSNIYVVPYPALLGMEFVRTQELDEEISYLLTLSAAGNPGKLSLKIFIFLHSAGVKPNYFKKQQKVVLTFPYLR